MVSRFRLGLKKFVLGVGEKLGLEEPVGLGKGVRVRVGFVGLVGLL